MTYNSPIAKTLKHQFKSIKYKMGLFLIILSF